VTEGIAVNMIAPGSRPASRNRAPWLPLVLAGFAVLVLGACQRKEAASAPPALVVAMPVHADPGSGGGESIRYPVEVAARYSNTMSFRVPGKLIERVARLGDTVRKGQAVARLDPIDARKQAASAQASFDAAEHRLTFANQQLDRDKAQAAQNLIAANQLEQTQDAFSTALAGREQAYAQLVIAQNALRYNTLVADHDGVITGENADTGQVVSAGQPVYGLAWTGDTDITLDAAQSDLARIAVGLAANVTFPTLPGARFEAVVREVAPAADPQSRTYRVKLTLTQPVKAVRLGMTGEATFPPAAILTSMATSTAATSPTFTVPATAIFHRGTTPAVWVIGESTSLVELRPVTVHSYSGHSSVITGGLNDGDRIVLAGVHTVYAGQHVKPVKPLFDGDGDVEGPAAVSSAGGAGSSGTAP
jgi:multidrug efflux system membrane fusion protein